MTEDEKFDLIIKSADQSGFTVDLIVAMINGLDDKSIAILLGNVSMLPKYMKSKEIPYLSLSRMAPSSDVLNAPLSH